LFGCGDSPTTLLLSLDGPHDLASLSLTITLDSGSSVGKTLPTTNGIVKLPGTVLVVLPDRMEEITIDASGHGPSGDLKIHKGVTVIPHQQVKDSVSLGESPDLAVAVEDGAVPDLAGSDLAGSDPAGAMAASDLGDGGPAVPTPRLISQNVYSDYG